MSTLPTYASPTPSFVTGVAVRLSPTRSRRSFHETDHPLAARVGQADSGQETAFGIASRCDELRAALGLVYRAYLRSGLIRPNPYRMRVTPFHCLLTTEVLVAIRRRKVICTMSVVGDGPMGLPMETIYGREVAWRRIQGARLAEVSCLADDRQGPESSFSVVSRLMALTAQSARRREIDELLIAVHPRHAKFYQRFLAFEPIGDEQTYATVCDHPAVALSLDLNRLPADHPRVYRRLFGEPFADHVLEYRPLPEELRSDLRFVADATYDLNPCNEPARLLAAG